MTVWRANLLGSSGKGMEYFMRHLLGVEDAVRAEESPPELRPREVVWRDEAPRASSTWSPTIDFRMTSTCTVLRHRAAGGHLVREARHLDHRHAPVRALVQPGHRPAVGDPHRLRRFRDRSARTFSRLAAEHLGTRTDVIAAPLLHDTADELAQPGGRGARLEARRVRPGPGRDDAAARHRRARLRARSRRRWRRSARLSNARHRRSRASAG